MGTVEEGLAAQVRNIEARYGKPMSAWAELIRASGKSKHGEVVAWLKGEYGLTHGSANRVALVVQNAGAGSAKTADPEAELFSGSKATLRPIHDRLMHHVRGFGTDIEIAPKKGYLSLRRKKQFAMIQPAATRVDVGMILKGDSPTSRLETAATFNALFTHRVRVGKPEEVDGELVGWLRRAYDSAG